MNYREFWVCHCWTLEQGFQCLIYSHSEFGAFIGVCAFLLELILEYVFCACIVSLWCRSHWYNTYSNTYKNTIPSHRFRIAFLIPIQWPTSGITTPSTSIEEAFSPLSLHPRQIHESWLCNPSVQHVSSFFQLPPTHVPSLPCVGILLQDVPKRVPACSGADAKGMYKNERNEEYNNEFLSFVSFFRLLLLLLS